MPDPEENDKVNEPQANYSIEDKKITFFSSFAEQEAYELKQMALQTHKQSLDKLEQLRLFFLKQHLLPDGNWKPIERIITITNSKTNA